MYDVNCNQDNSYFIKIHHLMILNHKMMKMDALTIVSCVGQLTNFFLNILNEEEWQLHYIVC